MKDRYVIDTQPVKSSTYMLPILDEQIDFEFLPLMVGSYLYNNREEKEFSVLYKFKGTEKFTEFDGSCAIYRSRRLWRICSL